MKPPNFSGKDIEELCKYTGSVDCYLLATGKKVLVKNKIFEVYLRSTRDQFWEKIDDLADDHFPDSVFDIFIEACIIPFREIPLKIGALDGLHRDLLLCRLRLGK